jgi:hypothetical protein
MRSDAPSRRLALLLTLGLLGTAGLPGARAQQGHDHEHGHEQATGAAAVAQLKLDGRIEAQVESIVANCKLPPAADANLHLVVADLLQGVSLMRGSDPAKSRHDGAALVHGALAAYGKYFDDPGWTP